MYSGLVCAETIARQSVLQSPHLRHYSLASPCLSTWTLSSDMCVRHQCPPEILEFIESHESYSISGNDCKGEGGDFVLEAKNRAIKRLLPPGLPDEQAWQRATRNMDRVAKIRKGVMAKLDIVETLHPSYTYSYDIENEISSNRKIIHDEGCSVQLDIKIEYFTDSCLCNVTKYCDNVKQTQTERLRKVPVTNEHRKVLESYDTLTKD